MYRYIKYMHEKYLLYDTGEIANASETTKKSSFLTGGTRLAVWDGLFVGVRANNLSGGMST